MMISDSAAIQLGLALIGVLGVVVNGIVAYLMQKLNLKAAAAATEAKQVKDVLANSVKLQDTKLSQQAIILKATHTLVNEAMGNLLARYAKLAMDHAEMTGNAEDLALARLACELAINHQKAQAIVDSQPGTDLEKKGIP